MTELSKIHELIKEKNENTNDPSPGTQYYLKVFKENEGFSRFASWNWGAFLFGPYWLLYRKMYFYAFLMLSLAFIAIGIQYISFSKQDVLGIEWLVGAIIYGVFGNAIFRHDLRKRLKNQLNRKGTNLAIVLFVMLLFETFKIYLTFKRGLTLNL